MQSDPVKPPPPPRATRRSLSEQDAPNVVPEEEPKTSNASEEHPPIEEHYVVQDIVENGETLYDQTVPPGKYLLYKLIVNGSEDDLVVIRIHKTMHSGTANIYVNFPGKEVFPSEESHQWDPTKGILEGPPGEYRVSVQAVASFSVEDDDTMVQSTEATVYDIYFEWELLEEKEREQRKKMREQYSRQKSSAVWSSAYNEEFQAKYKQQQAEFEQELAERERLKAVDTGVNLNDTPVTKEYKIGSLIASTGISTVKYATELSSSTNYAIKIIDKKEALQAGLKLNEQVRILQRLQHQNIVQFKQFFDLEAAFCILLELCGPDIVSKLKTAPNYNETTARNIVAQVVKAVGYIHEQGVVHRELVPENILFSNSSETPSVIKITGFNFAMSITDKEVTTSPYPSYQAPEVIDQKQFGAEVDMWQVGILAYILLSGYHPFSDTNTMRLYSKIRQGKFEFPEADWAVISNEAKSFVKSLLCVDVAKRLTAKQALEHPWLTAKDTNLPSVTLTNCTSNMQRNFTVS